MINTEFCEWCGKKGIFTRRTRSGYQLCSAYCKRMWEAWQNKDTRRSQLWATLPVELWNEKDFAKPR